MEVQLPKEMGDKLNNSVNDEAEYVNKEDIAITSIYAELEPETTEEPHQSAEQTNMYEEVPNDMVKTSFEKQERPKQNGHGHTGKDGDKLEQEEEDGKLQIDGDNDLEQDAADGHAEQDKSGGLMDSVV